MAAGSSGDWQWQQGERWSSWEEAVDAGHRGGWRGPIGKDGDGALEPQEDAGAFWEAQEVTGAFEVQEVFAEGATGELPEEVLFAKLAEGGGSMGDGSDLQRWKGNGWRSERNEPEEWWRGSSGQWWKKAGDRWEKRSAPSWQSDGARRWRCKKREHCGEDVGYPQWYKRGAKAKATTATTSQAAYSTPPPYLIEELPQSPRGAQETSDAEQTPKRVRRILE